MQAMLTAGEPLNVNRKHGNDGGLLHEEITQRVREVLDGRSVASINQLATLLALDQRVVKKAVRHLLDEGKVELLRPVGCESEAHDFYRGIVS